MRLPWEVTWPEAGRRPGCYDPTPTPQATSTLQPSATPYSVVASPSIEVAFINQVLSTYQSPAEGSAPALYDLGVQYGIDPVFALAFFMHESSFGTQGEATKSLSLGNLRAYELPL